jgi:hypothetical protein
MTGGKRLALIVALFATGEAKGSTLDLVCSAQKRAPIRFRLDTQQKTWCLDECKSVWAMDELSDSQMKLSLRTQAGDHYWYFYIERFTLKWWVVHRGYGTTPEDSGQCKVEPFSGFPRKQF